jgi:hypothetical protein
MSARVPVVAVARRSGLLWAMVPVVLLGAGVSGLGVLASLAAHDPSFALEHDYYQKAVHWDRQQAEWAENARLGYGVAVELGAGSGGIELVVRVTDRTGVPLRGARVEVEAFANARAADRRTLRLVEGEDGRYHAPLGTPRAGLWELRFAVAQSSDRFTHVTRVEVPRTVP